MLKLLFYFEFLQVVKSFSTYNLRRHIQVKHKSSSIRDLKPSLLQRTDLSISDSQGNLSRVDSEEELQEELLFADKACVTGRGLGGAKGNTYLHKTIYEKYYSRYRVQHKDSKSKVTKPVHSGISMELLSAKDPTEAEIEIFYSALSVCERTTELEKVLESHRAIINYFLLRKLAPSPLIGEKENQGIFSSVLHIKSQFKWITEGVEMKISSYIEDEMKALELYLLEQHQSSQFHSEVEDKKKEMELLGSKIQLWIFLLEKLAIDLDGVHIFSNTESGAPYLIPDENNRNFFVLVVEKEKRMTNISLEDGLEALIGLFFIANMEFPKSNVFMYDWIMVNIFRMVDNTGGVNILKKKETRRHKYKE